MTISIMVREISGFRGTEVLYFIIIIFVVGMDALIKNKMEEELEAGPLDPGWKALGSQVYFRKFHNTGAAFNFMGRFPKLMKIFHALTLFYVFVKLLLERRPINKFGLTLLAGGGLSNLSDRLRLGYVRDYISFRAGPEWFRKLVFNLSDFCVFTGLILLCIDAIRQEKKSGSI